jgi:hypothetical protein
MPTKFIFCTSVVTGALLAAGGPVILHGGVQQDCMPRIELCPASFLFSATDDPAPKNEPLQ